MIINMFMLKAAIILMLIIIVREILRKRFGIDMDNIDITNLKNIKNLKASFKSQPAQSGVVKSSGVKKVILQNAGVNKATVMATLRQITGLDYQSAKNLVDRAPSTIMSNVSEKEAELTKKALEFVGAKIEIK